MSTTTTSGVPITVGTVSTDLTSTITTTTTSYQPCGYVLPGGYTCARPKGHKGPHAF